MWKIWKVKFEKKKKGIKVGQAGRDTKVSLMQWIEKEIWNIWMEDERDFIYLFIIYGIDVMHVARFKELITVFVAVMESDRTHIQKANNIGVEKLR